MKSLVLVVNLLLLIFKNDGKNFVYYQNLIFFGFWRLVINAYLCYYGLTEIR